MPSPGSTTNVIDAPLPLPPGDVTAGQAHQRAAVTTPAANLHTLAPIPLKTTNPPSAVTLQVEAASAAILVFYTADGLTTASAVGCMQVPIAPQTVRIPFQDGFRKTAGIIGGISLFAASLANVAVFYEWDRSSQ